MGLGTPGKLSAPSSLVRIPAALDLRHRQVSPSLPLPHLSLRPIYCSSLPQMMLGFHGNHAHLNMALGLVRRLSRHRCLWQSRGLIPTVGEKGTCTVSSELLVCTQTAAVG